MTTKKDDFKANIDRLELVIDALYKVEELEENKDNKDNIQTARTIYRQAMVDTYKEWIEDLKEKAETERWNIVSHMNQKWLNANDIREDTKATDTILFRLEKIYEQMEKCEDGLNNLKKYKGVRI